MVGFLEMWPFRERNLYGAVQDPDTEMTHDLVSQMSRQPARLPVQFVPQPKRCIIARGGGSQRPQRVERCAMAAGIDLLSPSSSRRTCRLDPRVLRMIAFFAPGAGMALLRHPKANFAAELLIGLRDLVREEDLYQIAEVTVHTVNEPLCEGRATGLCRCSAREPRRRPVGAPGQTDPD